MLEITAANMQAAISDALSAFLRLYNLLHPARSADHEHITFSRLELPAQLQDQVQATDILRVGRMYEDLLAGGSKGAEVLKNLTTGASGDDEESEWKGIRRFARCSSAAYPKDDHIHHLLKLLDQSSVNEPAAAVPEEDADVQTHTAPESEAGQVAEEPSEVVPPLSRRDSEALDAVNSATKRGGGALNFLQDDELDGAQQEKEDEFELVPQAATHEVSSLPRFSVGMQKH